MKKGSDLQWFPPQNWEIAQSNRVFEWNGVAFILLCK